MMIYQAADEGEITEHEATHLVRPFLTAGIDTTVNGIGNTLLALATHPDEYRKLHHKPELARNAFEEGLRYDSPVQTFFRTTSREVETGGGVIPAHRKVLLFMQRPLGWLRAISHYRAEVACSPNFGFDLCVSRYRADQMEGVDLSSLRIALNGAEPVHDLVKALFGFDAIVGNYASPYAAGSAYVMLHHAFGEVNGKKGVWGHAIGGMPSA